MEKYLIYSTTTLDEMLAACRDYKERQNIRSALRELKGIKLEDNSFLSLSSTSRNGNPPSSGSSVTSSSDLKSRWENETFSKEPVIKQAPDSHRSSSTLSNGVNGNEDNDKYTNNKDENSNDQPKFRTYLYAGRIGSPSVVSPRYNTKKESHSPRKVHHTPITRVKVLDKSDLVDKSTETEEGDVSVKSDDTDKVKDSSNTKRTSKIIRARTVDKVHRFQSTPKPSVEPSVYHKNVVDLNTSAIEFSSDLDKVHVKGSSVLHRPVSVNIAELDSDKTNDNHHTSPVSQVSNVITSPRKPRKIVSYRTSAFTPASKLNPVSSTISRSRLASAPLFSDSSGTTQSNSVRKFKSESEGHIGNLEVSVANDNCDINDKQDDVSESCSVANDSSVESNSIGTKLRAANEQLKKIFNSDITYRASPCAIKVEDESSLVARLRKKLESKRKKDIKSDLEEFSYFTNKMKEKHGIKNTYSNGTGNSASESNIVLSPVSNGSTIKLGENEINEGNNTLISNYTSNKTAATMEDKNEANLLKKKSALSRRNRVDSEEGTIYRKYKKKPKSEKSEAKTQTVKTIDTSMIEPENVFDDDEVDKSHKKVTKTLSIRRKLPEVPVKQDSDPEDDETVHQRTIRLLQERRKERRDKDNIVVEKEVTDKTDKSKMSPAVLKKSLEQKLERSDSKRKAYRVRRELQLLNRENELKSFGDQSGSDDEVKSINDRSDRYYRDMYSSRCDSRNSRGDRKPSLQRSKSDTGIIHRRRAVSETDGIIKQSNDVLDGKSGSNNVLNMFEVEENLSPEQKINIIGNLMQEEAKLQEMLRMSTNFSEKRKMRGDIRQLRQKRAAIEGTSIDEPPTTRLRRSVSVTSAPVSRSHHVDVTRPRPESVCERTSQNYQSQTSIEELRKQLSETQDYDEKKKIRLALRQLRQQTRDGPQSGLQRSQSFVHRKNSEPVINGTLSQSNSAHVIRSQSVNEQRIPDKDSGQEFDKKQDKHNQSVEDKVKVVSKVDHHGNSENGSATRGEIEKLIQSRQSTAFDKPPIPKTVHKHSITSSKTSDSSKTPDSSKLFESSRTVDSSSSNSQGHPVPARNSIEAVIKKFSNHSNNSSVQTLKTHLPSESKTDQKYRNHDKDGDIDRSIGSHISRRHSSFDVRNSNRNINSSEHIDTHKPVDLLKDTVKILENQKEKRDSAHNEIKDVDKLDHDSGSTRKSRSEHTSHDKGSGINNARNSHILVSKAGIERDKQNRLVNLRRNRSLSEPRRDSSSKPVVHEQGSVAKKTETKVDNVKSTVNKKVDNVKQIVDTKSEVKPIVDTKSEEKATVDTKSEDIEVSSSNNSDTGEKHSDIKSYNDNDKDKVAVNENTETLEEDKRLSPPLLWLAEKRKSLNTNSESDKLLSTLDIEAAFSEILGAVEDFPDSNVAMDITSTDIPIVEEVDELSEMAESAVDTETIRDIQEETVNDVKDNTNDNNEIHNDTLNKDDKNEVTPVNGEDSEIPVVTETKKSKASILLRSDLSLEVNSKPGTSAISVIHGDDGTVTVKEVSRQEEGDTTITEWKKIRRSHSKTETRETDTIVEKKITSPGGNSTVYEKDISKTKHKLTSRGSNYFTRNQLNIKRRTNLDGSEVVEQDLSTVSENMSVTKNESWGDKSEAHVVLHKEPVDSTLTDQMSIVNGTEPVARNLEKRLSLPGDVGSNVIQSHLGKPSGCPEIISTLEELTINEGANVRLECTVVSSPVPDVTWYKGDNPLHESEDIHTSYDVNTGIASLDIKHVTVDDNAEYKCLFENILGSASTTGRLIVNKKSSGYPMFLTDLSDVTICEGSSLCLECKVSDVETVTWYKDGVIQRNNADFKQTFDGNKARLEIGEVFLDDCGTYACALKNCNGEKRSFCRVTVKEAESADAVFPMFLKKPETMIADELDPVIIESEVIGSPLPVITWLLDDMKLNEDNRHRMSYDGRVAMLVMRRVTTADSGRIQCLAENSSGKVSADCMLIVRASTSPPKVCQHLSDLTTISGKNITLKCIISGEPSPEITWRKNGLVIGQMFDFKQTYIDGLAILEISKCCSQDSGCYECLATNEKGETSTSCTLIVNEEPSKVEVTKPQSVPVSSVIDVTVKDKSPQIVVGGNKDIEIKHDHELDIKPEEVKEVSKLNELETVDQEIKEVSVAVKEEPNVLREDSNLIKDESKFNKEQSEYVKEVPKFVKEEPRYVEEELKVVKEEPKCVKGDPKYANEDHKLSKEELNVGNKDTEIAKDIKDICEIPTVDCKPPDIETEVSEKSVIEAKVSIAEEKVETSVVNEFSAGFTPNIDEEKKQTAKSQASKIMLVRNGNLKSVEKSVNKSSVKIDNVKTLAKVVDNDIKKKVVADNSKSDKKDESKVNVVVKHGIGQKVEVKATESVEKDDIDLNKNYTNKSNANIVLKTDKTSLKVDLDNEKEVEQIDVKSYDESSKLDPLNLEDKNAKTPKRVAKFRTGGEVRRSQSVRTPGNEKPEWLQVKLRRVGNNATPSSFMREIEKQQVESAVPASSSSDKNIVEDKPVSVQRVSNLGRSQSVKIVGKNPPSALNDSTNSPSGRESVKLTPVSERAKIFQMKDSNINRDSSGKSSPIDIISKAINLSRAESMKAPVGHRSGVVQRSQSFKTDTQATTSQRDITLELSPQKSQVEEEKTKKVERSSSVKYWDPTAPSTSKMDYSTYNDEEELGQMLSNSDNFDERKKIRARIKELRDAHMREWEAKQKAREAASEDIIKKKHREADAMKQAKLEQFKKQAAEHSEAKHLDVAEQHLREKHRLADENKKKQLAEYNQRAAVHQESTHLEVSERALQERIKQADILKQKTLDAYDKAAGKTDGKTVTTTRRVETTTKVGGAAGKPADEIAPQLAQQIINATGNVSGVLTVKTESWSSKDNVRHTSEKTESWGGGRGAMNAFKQMDAKNPAPKTNPLVAYTYAKRVATTMKRNAVTIKQDVLTFCKMNTAEYSETIEITNFSSSWNNGIAFCALIHHFYPEAFDFKALDPKQRRKNFELAFDTAEKYADIAPLLDVEDMVRMQKPDWKCVFTYVQSFYRKLANHERNKAAVPPSDG